MEPCHQLTAELVLPLPPPEVFAFFADAENLERITPPQVRFQILTPLPIVMQPGTVIDYKLSVSGMPMRWRTVIPVWEPPFRFVDIQESGPYGLWEHTHTFEPQGDGTLVRDSVRYRLPFYPMGELAHPVVKLQLSRIFRHRQESVARLLVNKSAEECGSRVEFTQ